jgi:hypothetical protein
LAIEIRHTKRKIVYRAIVASGGPESRPVIKTFRTRAAAEAWEREMLQAGGRAPGTDGSHQAGEPGR